jgi:hypothetical protein
MYTLKTLPKAAIPSALEKAKHYRLLRDPLEAESICRDVLAVEPDNQQASIILLLALTDTFEQNLSSGFNRAQEVLQNLSDQYCKAYYGGIIAERRAKIHLERGEPGSGRLAYEWFQKAMNLYETALTSCSPGNQDALLRWNTCARIIMQHPEVVPAEADAGEQMLE